MKHLVRLYPKRWRDRYAAEITALLQRERASVAGVLDLVRGAIDARLHPALAHQLVFVPTIGFRPAGTRVLLERAEASQEDTHLTVLAVAATPDSTELTVEWERARNAAVWMATAVGDPPIVTFRGAVLRYEGPWRLAIPLS